MPDNRDSQWHLDKRVPVALIITMLSGYAGGIWWISEMNSRMNNIERAQLQSSGDSGQIIRFDERLRSIERVITRLEAYLDNRRTEKTDRQYPGMQ